jgi:hypothetical protein
MSDYVGNCYELLKQVRYGLNEFSDTLNQGTDTSGKYQNSELVRHINNAQYFIWGILFKQFPEYFMTSASITFTSSVATLPSDCWKIREILDADGIPFRPINVAQKHIASGSGSEHNYYRYGNTLRIDADSISLTGTLWYYSRCRELDTGMTSAGGAASATLATTAKAILSYYNGMKIENVTDSTNDTITAYTAARVATVTNTWAASKYYGIVSDLPELFHPLIAHRAIITMKQSPRVPVTLTAADLSVFQQELQVAMQAFAGTMDGDTYPDDIFNDFAPMI